VPIGLKHERLGRQHLGVEARQFVELRFAVGPGARAGVARTVVRVVLGRFGIFGILGIFGAVGILGAD
jgi:hypothetical protein